MTDIVKALEDLLSNSTNLCDDFWYNPVAHCEDDCPDCWLRKNARSAAQAALDAVPVLEWMPRPVEDPEYSASAEFGPLFLHVSKNGWWEIRHCDSHCGACDHDDVLTTFGTSPLKTLEGAQGDVENAMRAMSVVFRTVAK